MEETPEDVVLKPVETRLSMIKKDGLWVHTGKVPSGFDVVQAIRDTREERIRTNFWRVKSYIDTNVLVAASIEDHPHYCGTPERKVIATWESYQVYAPS